MLTSFWETQDRVPAAGQPWAGETSRPTRRGRASASWCLLLVFAEAKAAKTTRNCWEVSESGLVRTALSGQRALGSWSGSPRPLSLTPSSKRLAVQAPPTAESPHAPPPPALCSHRTAAPTSHRPWLHVVLLLPSQPRGAGRPGGQSTGCANLLCGKRQSGDVPQALSPGPEDAEETAVHSKGPRHPHTRVSTYTCPQEHIQVCTVHIHMNGHVHVCAQCVPTRVSMYTCEQYVHTRVSTYTCTGAHTRVHSAHTHE